MLETSTIFGKFLIFHEIKSQCTLNFVSIASLLQKLLDKNVRIFILERNTVFLNVCKITNTVVISPIQ